MSMSAPVKFMFEDDFATGKSGSAGNPGKPAEPTVTLAMHEAALARAEADAYRNGMAAAETKIEGRSAAASERIAQALASLNNGLAAIQTRMEAESVEIAVAVARKLAPELIAAEPVAE